MNSNLTEAFGSFSEVFEPYLLQYFDNFAQSKIKEASLYSLLNGGKRIRPFLCLQVYRMLSGGFDFPSGIMNFALAVEFIHTYSLIHDDLPCMDNDDFRRGLPSCHKKFDVMTATLTGDALLTEAFCAISAASGIPDDKIVLAVRTLSCASGGVGMVGGQILDVGLVVSLEDYMKITELKTGALLSAACCIGAIGAGANEDELLKIELYARNIGAVFQIIDDILDVGESGNSILNFISAQQARKLALELTQEAVLSISAFENSQILVEFAHFLLEREK